MTDQHRATPEQWAAHELFAKRDELSSCILELRARVEQLEAALLSLTSTVAKTGNDHKSRIEALELRQRIHSVILSSAEQAEQGVVTRAECEAAIARVAAEARQAAMNELRAAPASLGRPGWLVERLTATTNVPEAIREVAKWLDGQVEFRAAQLLREEADRG